MKFDAFHELGWIKLNSWHTDVNADQDKNTQHVFYTRQVIKLHKFN